MLARVLLVILRVVFSGGGPASPLLLLLLKLSQLSIPKCLDPVGGARQLSNAIGNVTPSNKRNNNRRPDDECQDEPVDSVPMRCPSTLCRSRIGVVKEIERQELCYEGVFDR